MVDKKIADNESSITISVSQEKNRKLIQKYHFHYRKITGDRAFQERKRRIIFCYNEFKTLDRLLVFFTEM